MGRAALWRARHDTVEIGSVGTWLTRPVSSLPLSLFRAAFGLLMFGSTLRFVLRGWVQAFYVAPSVHFTYLGFGWVRPLPEAGMLAVFALLLLASAFIAAGLFTRASLVGFFLLFTYVELLDKTYYLNHYYFISLLSFLLIFLPLGCRLSLDVRFGRVPARGTVPAWTLYAVRLQLALVYLFAGLAKLEPDWLFAAQPLRIWLRANTELPLLGPLFDQVWVALAMSWAGLIFDLTIPFFLLWRRTRPLAYLAVIFFHLFTALLFPIGMFPWIMMVSTLIFFSAEDSERVARGLRLGGSPRPALSLLQFPKFVPVVLTLFFLFQAATVFRHTVYPGDVLWTEEGYRFSWRVMLAEKTGRALFTVRDEASGRSWTVYPSTYLSPQQEKQMAFQPDMILQFAHHLRDDFGARGLEDVSVTADVWVSLNGRPSRHLIDDTVDLAAEPYSLRHRSWVTALE